MRLVDSFVLSRPGLPVISERLNTRPGLPVIRSQTQATCLCPTKRIEALVRVPRKRIIHLSGALVALCSRLGSIARPDRRRVVLLRDLVDGEVLRVDGRGQLGLEGRADRAQRVPVDAAEEGVLLDLGGAAQVAEAVMGVADETVTILSVYDTEREEAAGLTVAQSPRPSWPASARAGSAGGAASRRSCGTSRCSPRRRRAASRSGTRT